MDIKKLYEIFLKYPKICTDSRKLEKDSIFIALKGENFDGHKFVKEALSNCVFALIEDVKYNIEGKTILVSNTLTALQNLARYHRKATKIRVLALTGTNGKTTTKELIKNVLETKYEVVATEGNLNNHLGVPLTLLNINDKTDLAIIEMGANHLDEINKLCDIAQPDYGLITNIGKAHLEGFGSFENVIKAKSELYDYLMKENKVIFQNTDNEILKKLTKEYKTEEYSYKNIKSLQSNESQPFLSFIFYEYLIETKLIGKYNLENVVAAIKVGEYFKVPFHDIKKAIFLYTPVNNRSQLFNTNLNTLIIDAYNANPSSMVVALNNFYSLSMKNKVIMLGDMFELGSNSNIEHHNVLDKIKDFGFTEVYLCGKEFYKFVDKYSFNFFQSTNELEEFLQRENLKEKSILIKGSRGMKMESLVKHL